MTAAGYWLMPTEHVRSHRCPDPGTRETVGQVLAEPRGRKGAPVTARDERSAAVTGAVPGSVVPVWRDGLEAVVLTPVYRRIMDILNCQDQVGALDCRQLAAALGLEPVPAKAEGVRSKAKRLVTRGWLVEAVPGRFSAAAGPDGGS